MSKQARKIVDYDADDQPNTDTHLSVDSKIRQDLNNPGTTPAYREGFDASSGVRPESAESGGRIQGEENADDPEQDRTPDQLEEQNSGLADS